VCRISYATLAYAASPAFGHSTFRMDSPIIAAILIAAVVTAAIATANKAPAP
jgi:hypothetical protein